MEGNDGADELARFGRQQHPNNLLPLSKRRRVTEWDALGLEPVVESEVWEVTSDVDSGGGTPDTSSHGEGDVSEEAKFSTDVSETCLGDIYGRVVTVISSVWMAA